MIINFPRNSPTPASDFKKEQDIRSKCSVSLCAIKVILVINLAEKIQIRLGFPSTK